VDWVRSGEGNDVRASDIALGVFVNDSHGHGELKMLRFAPFWTARRMGSRVCGGVKQLNVLYAGHNHERNIGCA